jgi:TonB family protein
MQGARHQQFIRMCQVLDFLLSYWQAVGRRFVSVRLDFEFQTLSTDAVLRYYRTTRERYPAIFLTFSFHVLAVCLLIANLAPHRLEFVDPTISLTIFGATPHAQEIPPEPALQKPSDVLVAMPDIQVDTKTEPASANAQTAAPSQILAPRPDPKHINQLPPLPAGAVKAPENAVVILKIMIQTDGSVSDAEISKSSGDARLDQYAAGYVKSNWRFLPAFASGIAISDWTTVLVPFRAAA